MTYITILNFLLFRYIITYLYLRYVNGEAYGPLISFIRTLLLFIFVLNLSGALQSWKIIHLPCK